MQKLTVSFRNSFMRMCFALILPVMIFTSCEEQVDDLWNTDDDGQKVSPLVGDWYADSMQVFGECIADSAYDLTNHEFTVPSGEGGKGGSGDK